MSVTAHEIAPLDDHNEVTTHILECVKFKMLTEKSNNVSFHSNPRLNYVLLFFSVEETLAVLRGGIQLS